MSCTPPWLLVFLLIIGLWGLCKKQNPLLKLDEATLLKKNHKECETEETRRQLK
jgi:hypothetical protein